MDGAYGSQLLPSLFTISKLKIAWDSNCQCLLNCQTNVFVGRGRGERLDSVQVYPALQAHMRTAFPCIADPQVHLFVGGMALHRGDDALGRPRAPRALRIVEYVDLETVGFGMRSVERPLQLDRRIAIEEQNGSGVLVHAAEAKVLVELGGLVRATVADGRDTPRRVAETCSKQTSAHAEVLCFGENPEAC